MRNKVIRNIGVIPPRVNLTYIKGIFLLLISLSIVFRYTEASEPKWVKSVLYIIGVNSLRLGSLKIIPQLFSMLQIRLLKGSIALPFAKVFMCLLCHVWQMALIFSFIQTIVLFKNQYFENMN